MTTFLRAFVFCDGCGQPWDNSTVPSARTASEGRREAKRDGWVRKRDGRDFCPYCANHQPAASA
jgi:hypothetical protein